MIVPLVLALQLATAAGSDLTIEGAPRHPTVNVTSKEVERAKKRIQSDPFAKDWFTRLRKSLIPWEGKDASWIRDFMPDQGACFAYGFTGCPICGGKWGTWGKAEASFDNPGYVTCKEGHTLPDNDHPDLGMGYVASDGRVHYFVGSYNAWVVETLLQKMAAPYSLVYLLTGDDRAGRMAAVFLDEIARIYPSCDKGSWDYPSNPPSGRLNRPWYQVARTLVIYVDVYDRIFDHAALDEPSATEGLTRRQNIEQNLLLNGAKYCYDESVKGCHALHNGQADYLRGVLAVGIVLGIPEYVRWPVDGPCGLRAMLANNVDRDGRYHETSPSYAAHTRSLYLTFTEPLLNYRGSVYPKGLNLYDDPKVLSFLLLPEMALVCLGHRANFGDMAPGHRQRVPPNMHSTLGDCRYTEYLVARVSDSQQRARYAALLAELRTRDADADRRMRKMTEWRLFHEADTPPSSTDLDKRAKRLLNGSHFFGQKGLAVLRQGTGTDPSSHAAILRFGPSLNHGHLDDLNVNYYAHGYDLGYDIGYSLGSTHTQVGWARQTISHNTVVVDETSHGGGTAGGSLYHFANLPGLVLADASSTIYAHAGVKIIRRLFALADDYALDVFRAKGDHQHDLPLHSLTTNATFDNLNFGSPLTGSLAGPEYQWGELQLNDGDMKGHANKPYWNPPPENGYGFLVRPAFAQPDGNWSATWAIDDPSQTRFELMALHDPNTQVITAVAPGLYPTFPKARYVIRRRTGDDLSSCFVSVWQASNDKQPALVKSIRRIDSGEALKAESGLAIVVDLANGQRDIWCLTPTSDTSIGGKDNGIEINSQGVLSRCRLQGTELIQAHLLDAHVWEAAGWRIALDSPSRSASVTTLPGNTPVAFSIDTHWPDDGRYNEDPLYVTNDRYSRNSAYTIAHVSADRIAIEQANAILGRGIVTEIRDDHTLMTRIPHSYALARGSLAPTGVFRGKLLRTDDGNATTSIRSVLANKEGATIDVDSTEGFQIGQAFYYHDVQSGDTVTVHHYASLGRVSPYTYQLRTNTNVMLAAPDGLRIRYVDKSGRTRISSGGRIPRNNLPSCGITTITLLD